MAPLTTAARSRLRTRNHKSPALAAKAPTGIIGLDEALAGGLPRARTTLFFGGPGSGKTVLSLQILVHGARTLGEPGIFVAFEENTRQIIENAASFGWDLPTLEKGDLFLLDAGSSRDAVLAGKFDLNALLAGLGSKVRAMGARRVVFDAVDVLLMLLDDPVAERAELGRIQNWLQQHQLTGIVTAKAETDLPFSQARYGFAAYLADCALLLRRRHQNAVSERDLSILKYRGSSFSENRAPFVIGPSGIEVAEESARPAAPVPTSERLSAGVARLDTMLNGGYLRASSALITGLPGTAKSSLCGAFLHAACAQRERGLYVSFDEQAHDTVRNLTSINIHLAPLIESGRLRMLSILSLADSAEVQLMRVRRAIREQAATCVVIDPLSALSKSSDPSTALVVMARFIHWAKVNAITLVCTSLSSGGDPYKEATDLGISTLCDTWIHLAYAHQAGERNRALTIVKSRGTKHSSQVRELILADDGISLADVYEVDGELVMGTLRWEAEGRQREEERRLQAGAQKKRIDLERTQAEIQARSEALRRELELNAVELAEAQRIEDERLARSLQRREALRRQRGADHDRGNGSDAVLALPSRRKRLAGGT
jgi:circadian clock protein KaiC